MACICLVEIGKGEISFRQIHKQSGRRVNYEKVVAGVGKIDSGDIVKGYQVDSDTYVVIEPEEIDALKLESKKTIFDIRRTVITGLSVYADGADRCWYFNLFHDDEENREPCDLRGVHGGLAPLSSLRPGAHAEGYAER